MVYVHSRWWAFAPAIREVSRPASRLEPIPRRHWGGPAARDRNHGYPLPKAQEWGSSSLRVPQSSNATTHRLRAAGIQGLTMPIRDYQSVRQMQPMEFLKIVFAGIADDDQIIFRAWNNMEGVSIPLRSPDLKQFLREDSAARLSLTTKKGFVFGFCLRSNDDPLPGVPPSLALSSKLHHGGVYLFDEPIHWDDAVEVGLATHVDLDHPAPIAGLNRTWREWQRDCGSTHSLSAVLDAFDEREAQKKAKAAAKRAAASRGGVQ